MEKSAAIITIKGASDMTNEGRRAVADWLRQNARFLEDEGHNFDKGFRARYLYLEE